jgi:ATP-binding cassette, subfamily B, bacterial PglK
MLIVGKFLDLLTPSEQKQAFFLFFMVVIMALLDVLGVASIMPFMAVLANPELVESNYFLNFLYENIGFKGRYDFLFALGLLVFLLLIFSLFFKALTTYKQTRFALMLEHSIGKRLVAGYLQQPYSWFLNQHSGDLGKSILSEVANLINGGILPLMTFLAQITVAFGLLLLLLFVNPLLSVSVFAVLGSAYAIVYKLMSSGLKNLGEERILANQQRFKAVTEAFGASKEVKLGGLEQTYIQNFARPAEIYAKGQAKTQIIAELPRFLMEAVAFGGLLLVILYLMAQSGSFAKALPVVALYALAGYRLMPALQQIYASLIRLRFLGPALDVMHKDLKSLGHYSQDKKPITSMLIKQGIDLSQVDYTYPGAHRSAIKNISLYIQANSTVGLVGSTGSGKTTTIDVILGLLVPQSGGLSVDGQAIGPDNIRMWQKSIGYVPQHIYLSDDTVAANIAFGMDSKEIDMHAVERAAVIANLHEFVSKDLPQGYQTTLGERGIRLSGGQRQRIGIARALYHSPQVLILDEATSALDNLTEQAVMDAVHNLSQQVTIILIAHRLTTVIKCDQIFFLEKGEIKSQGTFEELFNNDPEFRAMAEVN